jgi:hypothetical protein
MIGWSSTVERRCNECGTAWLLTKEQARVSTRPLRRPVARGLEPLQRRSSPQIPDAVELMGSQTARVDQNPETRDTLRRCPKCTSGEFTDRPVTRANPASPDACGPSRPESAPRNRAGPRSARAGDQVPAQFPASASRSALFPSAARDELPRGSLAWRSVASPS